MSLTNFSRRATMPGSSVSSLWLLRQVSSVLSRNCRNEPRPDVDEAWFVTVNFMARQLHALVTRTPKYRIAREVALHTVKGFTLSFATIKIIATYSVGFEHIDLESAARRKLPVAYTPGVNSEATADIAMLLLLGASRRAYETHAGPGQCGGGAER